MLVDSNFGRTNSLYAVSLTGLGQFQRLLLMHSFFYKDIFYKYVETEKLPKCREHLFYIHCIQWRSFADKL